MRNEIERKFFVQTMPDLSGLQPRRYERYILSNSGSKEVRISKVDGTCFLEEKQAVTELERVSSRSEISQKEFDELKGPSDSAIIRERYSIGGDPEIVLQVYHGRFEGLVRAEIEFPSRKAAEAFAPPQWLGREMTGLPVSRDATLAGLSDDEFHRFL